MNATKRIRRAHIGRPCAFAGFDGAVYYGAIVAVRRSVVTLTYHVPIIGEVTGYVSVTDKRIEVY